MVRNFVDHNFVDRNSINKTNPPSQTRPFS